MPSSIDVWVRVPERRNTPSRRPRPVASGYGHVVTAKDRENWQRWHDAKAQDSYRRGTEAGQKGRKDEAVYWLGRAARMARHEPNVIFAYAMALLAAGRWQDAAKRMAWIAERFIMRKALVGRAIALSHLGQWDEAVALFGRMLGHYAPSPEVFSWADVFARHAGFDGWCATSNAGEVFGVCPGPVTIRLDDGLIAQDVALPFSLPETWRKARRLVVESDGRPLYGSPIALPAIRQVQGFVTVRNHHLEGWIWYPADPDFTPHAVIEVAGEMIDLTASQIEQGVNLDKPLARPRHFGLPLDALPEGIITLRDRYGTALTGSPLGPAVIAMLDPPPGKSSCTAAPSARRPEGARPLPGRASGCLVIIPAYRDAALTRRCIEAVLREAGDDVECLVIDDASPEEALSAMLDQFEQGGRITLVRHEENLGFTASANAGLEQARGRDVVLLNSDALLPKGGLARLRAWFDVGEKIGTVTPFSNDATILSYPSVEKPNPTPDLAQARALDRIFASLPRQKPVDLPTGIGFCMGIRGDCLVQTGLLDVALFAQGYGEENDFCCRASALGWRHIAASDLFVLHIGSVSFGRTRSLLLERNLRLLNCRHPGYEDTIAAFVKSDPLGAVRRNAGLVRMIIRRAKARSCLIMVTHDSGGGVERVVQHRLRKAQAEGSQVLILRPHERGCRIEDCGGDTANLIFDLPHEWLNFVAVLKRMKAERLEWHHLIGHAPAMHDLASALGMKWDIILHDYVWFCPRICLIGPNGHYCGEPALAGCVSCVAQQGALVEEHLSVAELVAQSDRALREARQVIAGSNDLKRRMARHFPGLEISLQPFEAPLAPLEPRVSAGTTRARKRICIPGAIGREKGYEIVLQLAEEAAKRDLPLDYVIVGYTIDDDRLMATGHVLITGEYKEDEATDLIREFDCSLGLIPSLWPETWCFALSNIWNAGLRAVSFDIGAQSERIQKSGQGAVVPLGMPVPLLSNLLLHLSH